MVYAETSINYERIEDLDAVLDMAGIALVEMPRPALFLAGKVFRAYRKAGGARTGALPDFLIGAHATVARLRLLTRDARRYRTYYPRADLIAPQRELHCETEDHIARFGALVSSASISFL